MRAILRPIVLNKWSGKIKFRNCYEDIGPYYTRSGMVYTGLTRDDEKRLGELLGIDLSRGSSFWTNFFIRVQNDDIILNLEDPRDELKYLYAKNHRKVKTSIFEHKASARFLLINNEEEAKRSNLLNKTKRRAIREFDTLTSEDIRKALRLFGLNGDNMEPEVAEDKLYKVVENNPDSFLDKWVNNKHRETEVTVERAISMNIIRRSKNIYRYGSEVIGRSMIESIDFLESPKNQDILLSVMKAIQSKVYMEPINVAEELEEMKLDEKPFVSTTDVNTIIDLDEEEIKFKFRPRKKGDTV
jgi:hypothetical protein